METLLTIANRILNPKSDLSRLHKKKSDSPQPNTVRRGRLRARHIIFNFPLLLGGVIVVGLFLIVLFGPLWAVENPYLAGQRTITFEDGQMVAPPFPPSETFPLGTDQWGKDILSLLLYGARNTLVACVFITMARLLIGLILGGLAGWNEGKLPDRLVMGAIGLTTSLPILLSSMILILAFDIRLGLPVFILATSVVGWAEVAQYIRSEFLVLRQKPFIEGAHAVGLPGLDIAVRHVLPNILPHLIVITLLEMGAVLMLLGELGFIGVYIGGGTQTEVLSGAQVTIPDIPEWGAMMADSRRWARAQPWMVFFPALAFFISVVGFNTLAEGLRRLLEQATLSTAFLLKKRMVVVIALITAATIYTINNVGPAPSYAKLAGQFNSELAYAHVRTLAGLDGRGNGQPGGLAAAEYIAGRFQAYGLQPAGRGNTYFHAMKTRLVQPLEQPALVLLDEAGQPKQTFRHQLDFGFVTQGHGGSGQVQAGMTFVGFREQDLSWAAYRGLDLRGQIVLLLAGNAPPDFPTEALIRGAQGVLWVTGQSSEDLEGIRSQIQLADALAPAVGGARVEFMRRPTLPIFRIRPAVAEALLAPSSLDLAALRAQIANRPMIDADSVSSGDAASGYETGTWFVQPLAGQVRMALTLTEPEEVELVNVLGYLPGQDIALDEELVIVSAHYDGLGRDPDGTVYPAANNNASGVGVLLEMIRLWQERGLTPRRTVLFAAWVGGELDYSGAAEYFDAYLGGISLLAPVAIFQLDNLGAGGDTLLVETTSDRLGDLMLTSGRQVGLSIRRAQRDTGRYPAYQALVARQAPSVLVSWPETYMAPTADDLARIEPEKLRLAGEAVILALTNATRLPSY